MACFGPKAPQGKEAGPSRLAEQAGQPPQIVIGIDFGTTFSGIAWARTSKPEFVQTVTAWPRSAHGFRTVDREKAPSELLVEDKSSKKGFFSTLSKGLGGSARTLSWGYQLSAHADPLRWFKLLLLDETDMPPEIRNSRQVREAAAALKASGMSVIEAVAAYLGFLWAHALEDIKISLTRGMFLASTLHVVITLPAIWPKSARDRMAAAATSAGIFAARPAGKTTLSFVTEPEAAALAMVKNAINDPLLREKQHFVVCDAGGGTVDIITYQVEAKIPFLVRESVRGEGKLCGGIFLDQAFLALVADRAGPAVWESYTPVQIKHFLDSEWEHGIKAHFGRAKKENQQKTWTVILPSQMADSSEKKGLGKTELKFSHDEIAAVFDTVVDDIKELIHDQIRRVKAKFSVVPQCVFLVGGLGQCQYLQSQLVQEMEALGGGIQVRYDTGDRPWTAVCRGAVIRGLQVQAKGQIPRLPNVMSRVCRKHYGYSVIQPWNPLVHLKEDMYWDSRLLTWMGRSVSWFRHMGDHIADGDHTGAQFTRRLTDKELKGSKFSEIIYSCKEEKAPTRRDMSVLQEVATVSWTSDFEKKDMTPFTNKEGTSYNELSYTIQSVCDGDSAWFRACHGDKVMNENAGSLKLECYDVAR